MTPLLPKVLPPRYPEHGALAIALVLIASLSGLSSSAARKGFPTLVDVGLEDGLGDLIALTLAVRNPQIDVVGVVTTKSPNSEGARAIEAWLEFLDRPDIQVGEGGEERVLVGVLSSLAKKGSTGSIRPAASVIRSAVQDGDSSLQVLVMGSGSTSVETALGDPLIVSGFGKLIWTQPPDPGSPFAGLASEDEIGPILFGATCALVVCDSGPGAMVALGSEDRIALGRSRSELTDELTALATRHRRDSGSENATLEAPHTLAVAYSAGLSTATPEYRSLERAPDGSIVFAATGERHLLRVPSPNSEILRRFLFDGLTRSSLRFRVQFAHFLNALLRMDAETKDALKGKLDAPFEKESRQGKTRREMMVEYLEEKLNALRERSGPSVETALAYLEEAYLGYAEIGWWFPDEFYDRWEFDPSTAPTLRFGVANRGGLPLRDIAAGVRIGEVSMTQSVESATEAVTFDFAYPPAISESPRPASAELSWRFRSGGGVIERSRYIDISKR